MIQSLEDLKNLSVTIMGLGLHGGGVASAVFFVQQGSHVTVTDLRSAEVLQPSIDALKEFSSIKYVLGEHKIEDFETADIVIKNPGVKHEGNPFLRVAKCIETDISIFLRLSKAQIIAVTGSKGKSSTVSALYYGLKKLGYPAFLGGNITVSPLTFLKETTNETPVVLELSSWQLADLRGKNILKPFIAIITPVMPDHQNWYGNMEAYVADKKCIYENQDASCFTICNYDDEWGEIFAKEAKSSLVWYSKAPLPKTMRGSWINEDGSCSMRLSENDSSIELLLPKKIAVPGIEMKQNVLNAAQALVLFGAKPQEVCKVMKKYVGIAHRLEFFHEKDEVHFYNDSAATIPEASVSALKAFEKPIILLMGGTNKALDFEPFVQEAHYAKRIILLKGSGTDLLIPLLQREGICFDGPFDSLDSLIAFTYSIIEKGDVVVFSPGATSFGMFKNEFDRGNKFKKAVRFYFESNSKI